MSSIATANSGGIVVKAAQCIRDNKEYLSTIDGLIGDGDHGINMDKGAGIYLSRQSEAGEGLQENLKLLSRVLMNEIGGSMGPLYGTFFGRLARTVKVDTLTPAVESLKKSVEAGDDFSEALNKMEEAAEAGKESTKDLVAKLGRASRLGERSRGVLDAGATSCCLIIKALSQGIKELLQA